MAISSSSSFKEKLIFVKKKFVPNFKLTKKFLPDSSVVATVGRGEGTVGAGLAGVTTGRGAILAGVCLLLVPD